MNAVKISLLTLVAILLLVTVIDGSRTTKQLQAMRDLTADTNTAQRKLADSIAALNAAIAAAGARGVNVGAPTTSIATPAIAAGDGNPKLGTNFLLPYDRSYYHPEWQGGTLRLFNSTPKGLNPLIDNSTTSRSIHQLVNDYLCSRSPRDPERWMAGLAESVVISDDYRTYTLSLRHGVMWTRPVLAKKPEFAWLDREVPFTSADVKFTLDTICDAQVDAPSLRSYYEDLERVDAPDPYTVVLHWKRTIATSISYSLEIMPLPKHIYGCERDGSSIPKEKFAAVFNKHWFDDANGVCGVGRFVMNEYEPDRIVKFTRNQAYWGAPLHFDAIEWNLAIKDDDPQLIAFKNGQVHNDGLSPLKYKSEILDHQEPRFAALDANNPKAGRSGELGWERVQSMSFSYIGWNLRKWPFDDLRVRQAMSHAFPKNRIISDVFFGLGKPVLSDVLLDSKYCNHELKPYAFDLERAKALLAEAGWTDTDGDGLLDKQIDGKRVPFAFTVKYYAQSPEWDNTLLIYRNELRKIGIDLTPLPLEWKKLIAVYEDKDFQAVVGAWQMDWDIDYFQLWHSSQADVQGGSNHCGFKNARVDELADKLRVTLDTDARVVIAKELQALIHEQQPYLFFMSGEGIFIWQNQPAVGQPANPNRYLEGVIQGLDELHPLTNRSRLFWHQRR